MQTRRQEILTILKCQGEATVDELARDLELTPVTVRHHLDVLRADSLVEVSSVRRRRGPGRPQYLYTLTEQAADHFPQSYDVLVGELLDEIKTQLDRATVKEILDRIADHRVEKAPVLDPDSPIEERLEKLVAYMTEQGYIAGWKKENGNFYIFASNCPYHRVAAQHPELCSVDLYWLERLSGAKLVRLQSMADGALSCVYQVTHPATH